MNLLLLFWVSLVITGLLGSISHAAGLKTENVFLIMTDGLRWQEVFTGAETDLMTRVNGGVANTNALRAKFWRERSESRQPFLKNNVQ